MDMNPAQLIDNLDKMSSFPEVALQVSEVLEDDRSGAKEIGAIIENDPGLSAALLRIANSAIYNVGDRVDNVIGAIKVVGMREVRDITYAVSAANAFEDVPNELISIEDFWRHSLYCALTAEQLAIVTRSCRGVSLFTAGLLHDIGQLVMFNQLPDQTRVALQNHARSEEEESVCKFEREVFGFDHTDVGDVLAERWKFPDTLRLAIRHHHTPFNGDTERDVAHLVAIANSVAVLAEIESENFSDAPPIDEQARIEFGLDDEKLLAAAAVARESAEALLGLFVK